MKYSKIKELYKRNLLYKEHHRGTKIRSIHLFGYHTYKASTYKVNMAR